MAYLYGLSFSFFVALTGGAVLASAASVVLPAIFSNGSSSANWNVISIVGSYIALAVLSLGIYLSRKITIIQKIRRIPNPGVAIKDGDMPSFIAVLVASEYNRACGIYQLSQPRVPDGYDLDIHDENSNINFRQAILDSVDRVESITRALLPLYPRIGPNQNVASFFIPFHGILLSGTDPEMIEKYDELIQLARYSNREPARADYNFCIRLCGHLEKTLSTFIPHKQAQVG